MEYGYLFDYAQVQITTDNGSNWIPLEGQYTFLGRNATWLNFEPYYGGVHSNWVHEIMDISEYVNNPFTFRYLLKSDDIIFMDGWYVDNVKISVFDFPNDVEQSNQAPTEFCLEQNYPNPFNPSTTFRYSIPNASEVTIKVYDILGKEIETLVNEEKPAGTYEVTWYAANLPSGVYFYQLKATPSGGQAGSFGETKKMILMK